MMDEFANCVEICCGWVGDALYTLPESVLEISVLKSIMSQIWVSFWSSGIN